MAYMEIFGNCSHSPQSTSEFLRHSVHTCNITQSENRHHFSSTSQNSVITHSQTMRYMNEIFFNYQILIIYFL